MEEILNILMKKLASVAEEGVRVEEDAGCHAARRPGAGARPGLFLYLFIVFSIFVLCFFLLYLLDQVYFPMFVHSIFYICS